MRKITIVGAGHSGLQLGIGLLGQGYDVTILSNRTAEQIAQGKILSSQSMYDLALSHERDLDLNYWDDDAPWIDGAHITAGNTEAGVMLNFSARMSRPGQSIDQRVKMPRWMAEFERRGGKLRVQDVDLEDLERYAVESDLVIVAAGKGEIGKLFERDHTRSVFDKPQRTIALTYLHGMKPRDDYSGLNIHIHPGVGELVHFPGYTLSGPCDIVNIESIVGGPMDRWDEVRTPADHLALTLSLIREFFPWEAHRFDNVRLTDDNGILAGRVTPTVRKGVGILPSGKPVLGIADVLLLNDPMTGQGSNNASKGATLYQQAIVDRDSRPFDLAWMEDLTERCWRDAQWSMHFTNAMLLPPPPHVMQFLGACTQKPALAHKFADSFNDPRTLSTWFYQPEPMADVIAEAA